MARPGVTGAAGFGRCQDDDGVARVNVSSRGYESAEASRQLSPDLRVLFHRLNNQLGVVLACAELLEAKASDDSSRARAAEVVSKVLDAMGTAREIRQQSAN